MGKYKLLVLIQYYICEKAHAEISRASFGSKPALCKRELKALMRLCVYTGSTTGS